MGTPKSEADFVFPSPLLPVTSVSGVSGPWKRENFFIDQVSPFVTDTIWLGIPNDLLARLTLNGETAPTTRAIARQLMQIQSNGFIWNLYFQYKNNPQIEWKDSIKKVVGLDK